MFSTHPSDGLAIGLLDTISKHAALDKQEWDLCSIDEWKASALGAQPETFEELEDSLDPHHFHVTIRTLAAGTHEAKAIRHAAARTKHVLPLLAVARITPHPDRSPAALAVDDPWATDPFGPVAEDMEGARHRDYDLFDRTPKFTGPNLSLQSPRDDVRHTWLSPRASGAPETPVGLPDAAQPSFVRKMKEELAPEGLVGGCLGAPLPSIRAPRTKLHNTSTPLLKALWREVASRAYIAAAATGPPADENGATHMLLVQHKGTPMYGSEMEDPELAQNVFLALKDVHRAVVHGDVNPSNIVWDPSGHFFQFVDLEFATWPGKVLVAPVATTTAAADDVDQDTAVADSHEFHSADLPTASDSSSLTQHMHTPGSSIAHMPPSPLSNAKYSNSGFSAHATPPPVSPSQPRRFSQRWSPDTETSSAQHGPASNALIPQQPRESTKSHGSRVVTPQGPRSHNEVSLSPSFRDPFSFVCSSNTAPFAAQQRGPSSSGMPHRPAALDIPRSPMKSAHSGRLSTPGGSTTPGGRSMTGGGDAADKLRAAEEAPVSGFATGTLARIVSDDLVTWPLGPGAHGSTQVARLAPHGTLEYSSFNQLKGCWPTAADDTMSLFWTLVRCHCPHSLWWGGIPFQSLCEDAHHGTALPLPMQEEASLLAYAQVVYLTTDSPTVTLKRRRSSSSAAGAPPAFSTSATVPFVPANADAQVRWKHYLFRAFAGRHLLTLTAAAGTPAEHKALGDFHAALGGLLPRVCRSGGLGGAPVPMSDEDALLVEEIDRNMQKGGEPLSYTAFLDRLDTIDRAQARIDAMREANTNSHNSEGPTPLMHVLEDAAIDSGAVCFHGMHELHTSTGNIVWLLAENEAALEAQYALAMPPWRLGADLPPATTEPITTAKNVTGEGSDAGSGSGILNSVSASAADSAPLAAQSVRDMQMHVRDETAAQVRWNMKGGIKLEVVARALRVAVAAPTATAPEGRPANLWDTTLTWLQGCRAHAMQKRRSSACAFAAMVLLNPEAALGAIAVLLVSELHALHALEGDLAVWQAACTWSS